MSSKERPTLGGTRIKTRKRNIAAPLDPAAFSDAVVQIYLDNAGDLELIAKSIESSDLNFSRYGDTFFEVVFTGGRTQPGTTKPDEGDRHPHSIIECEPKREVILPSVIYIQKILRRRPFLIKNLENVMRRFLQSLELFEENERKKLAIFTALAFSQKLSGLPPETVLQPLLKDNLVAKGLVLSFMTDFFKEYLIDNSLDDLISILKRGKVEDNLLDFFPPTKRSNEAFSEHFSKEGLVALVEHSFLDACIHDVASSVEQNLGFDQSLNFMKKKLEIQLQKHIGHYLKERVAPCLLTCLDKENEYLKQLTESSKELALDQGKKDGAVKKVLLMLEEYCNAHETARAAKSAASLMKKQVNELKEALRKTALEVVQMEWMHDASLNPSYNRRIRFEKYLDTDDSLYTIILNLSRSKLLDNVQSAVSKITTSMDCLQSCERNSLIAEGQLERAMAWACGNSSNSGNTSTKNSGIPPEFHEHIKTRRQILWESREKASDIVKLCVSVLEFEASRDGYLHIPDQPYPFRSSVDAKTWQQVYLNALTRLDATFHSYSRTEQEWKLAQCTVEAASNGLYTATNELCIASLKAKSASGDLQNTVLSMRDCAYEASVALSAFVRISRIHTTLTSESGSMLEEVLAITEDIHDVYNLGKEAAAIHLSLMEGLSKANAILFPLESVLTKDVAAMADAIDRESETKKEISHIHGQAIYQSYCLRIREACQTFKPLVPSLMLAVKGLYSLLTRLARTANVHAGNLHKALEGIGESQEVKSVDTTLSRSDVGGGDAVEFDGKEGEGLSRSEDDKMDDFIGFSRLSLEDKGWVSPPDSICCTSSGSDTSSAEVSLPDSLNDSAGNKDLLSQGSGSRNPIGHMQTALLSQTEEEISPFGVSQSSPEETDLNGAGSVKSINEASEHPETIALLGDKTVAIPANSQNPTNENLDKFDSADEPLSAKEVKNAAEHRDQNINANTRVGRGKNAYALSVLRRVEMKIDGRDISESREIDIAEQVDYLLKQATSVDNLCNMYEGWTPWI